MFGSSGPSVSPENSPLMMGSGGGVDPTTTVATATDEPVDLKEKMQYRIDLQKQYNTTTTTSGGFEGGGSSAPSTTLEQLQLQQQQQRSIMPSPTARQQQQNDNNHNDAAAAAVIMDPDVGKGQLHFPSAVLSDNNNNHHHTSISLHHQQQGAVAASYQQHEHDHEQIQHRYADYVDPYEPMMMNHNNNSSSNCCCCPCLWKPLTSCLYRLWRAENLHRSVCYGAIDGMLTGAGIVATFCGMGLLLLNSSGDDDNESQHHSCLWVVAFSIAACTSDALCMAVGHVWSTHVLSTQSVVERRAERQAFEQDRADAKGKLVDMLLGRGMLKIDAVSIADTLEGYPDIFVSALVGENFSVLGDGGGGDNHSLSRSNSGSKSLVSGSAGGCYSATTEYGTSGGASSTYRSYGQFNEFEHDPEAAVVQAAVNQSQKEATAMMIAFSLFGGVPGLILFCVSKIAEANSQYMSVTSASMTTASVIMILLGYWKSYFFDANWVTFAVEAVVVLFVCITSAYFLGSGLGSLLPNSLLLVLSENDSLAK